MDGMNEYGLVMAYNFMHRKKPENGFVCYMVGRLILENCKNVTEAIKFLKEVPHRSSFSYILMDRHSNYAIVEVTPRSIDVRYEHICTNHFELLTHENRNYTRESKERLNRVINKQLLLQIKISHSNYLTTRNTKSIANYLRVGLVQFILHYMNLIH